MSNKPPEDSASKTWRICSCRGAINESSSKQLSTSGQGRLDGSGKDLGDVRLDSQGDFAKAIVLGLTAIDDHVRDTSAGGDERDVRGGINRKRRTQRNHQIGAFGCSFAALDIFVPQVLPETDRCGFKKAAAFAQRRLASFTEVFEVGRGIGAAATRLALDLAVGAVKFCEKTGIRTRASMETIDILGNNGEQFAGPLKTDDRMMRLVGDGITKSVPTFEFVIPVFEPGGFRTHEIMVVNRLPPFPNALRTAKIGDATAGGNARASEYDDLCCLAQEFNEAIEFVRHRLQKPILEI